MKLKHGFQELVAQAECRVASLDPSEVAARLGGVGVLLVDLRDIRELKREGRIPGSVHVPRGMLEFWIDPASPYYRNWFDTAEQLILYCNKGWRSALAAATLQDMGIENVYHMKGGMELWIQEGMEIQHE